MKTQRCDLYMKMVSFWFLGKGLNQTNLCKNAKEFNAANRMTNRYLKAILSQMKAIQHALGHAQLQVIAHHYEKWVTIQKL